MNQRSVKVSRRAAIGRIASAFSVLLIPRPLLASRDPFPHPDPREGISSDKVIATADLGTKSKSVIEAYDAARANPAIFDGLYCVCECDKNMGHRSLLGCYESRQAVGCHSCREQAQLIVKLLKNGDDLAAIRKAFDEKWG
ncbi:MAG TPA: PCYCGC motif-containing (lipo)protein [Gemmatimonadaceae bacterium]|nr:PCYCGC motif-containing (lipo)protein [Gemmatimonadaceae bacterium]